MPIVSNIENYFAETGKIRQYADKIATNDDTISIQIPANGLQTIQIPQNSWLDNHKIRAIQILAEDQMFYGNLPDGTTIENLNVAALPSFVFTLGLDNEEIATIPFTISIVLRMIKLHKLRKNSKMIVILLTPLQTILAKIVEKHKYNSLQSNLLLYQTQLLVVV